MLPGRTILLSFDGAGTEVVDTVPQVLSGTEIVSSAVRIYEGFDLTESMCCPRGHAPLGSRFVGIVPWWSPAGAATARAAKAADKMRESFMVDCESCVTDGLVSDGSN